jgi:hypothetical protein
MSKFNYGDLINFQDYMGSGAGEGEVITKPGDKHSYACYGIKITREDKRTTKTLKHNLHGGLKEKEGWFFPPEKLSLREIPYDPTQMGDRDDDI